MKIQKFLFATMLCGVFGVFTACSDDVNPVTGDADNNNPVAEEVETVLTFSAGVNEGNFFRTRSDEQSKTDETVNKVNKMAVALFKVDAQGNLGSTLAFSSKDNVEKDEDELGYTLPALKFKVSVDADAETSKVALVVLANYDEKMFKSDSEDVPLEINTFAKFKEQTDLKMYPNIGAMYQSKDGTIYDSKNEVYWPYLYPMSSNIHIYNILPGKVNSIGILDEEAVLAIVEDKTLTTNDVEVIDRNTIPLYRGAAEIELTNLTFEGYAGMDFDKFVLESVFIMNAPAAVNWINSKTEEKNSWTWGNILTQGYNSYIKLEKDYLFFSGDQTNDNIQSPQSGAGQFRLKEVSEKTSMSPYLSFTHSGKHNRNNTVTDKNYYWSKDDIKSYYGIFKGAGSYSMSKTPSSESITDMLDNYPYIKFVVAPNDYGIGKSICLVVKGKYFAKAPDTGISIGGESKYYTVVVNESNATSTLVGGGVIVNNGEVQRNVKYDISLTISGPGSDTPWDYTKNSYVVPKVRIVPFGLVEQDSKLD